jgi:hypothetical protein
MTEIRIPVPRLPRGFGARLLGLAGLVAFALAIGGLSGNWWWSVLVGGAFAVGLAYIAETHAAAEAEADATVPVPAAARTRVHAVPVPATA